MWDYGEENRCVELAAVSIAMAGVSVVAVAMRSYTMSTILKRFVIEDWLAVLTCLLQIGFCVIVVVGVSYGLGAHVDDVPEVNRPKALIFKWAGQVAYIVVSTLVKFVVGIFLLRLCVNNNWQRITIIVLLIVVGLFNIFYVFIAIFQCQPVAFYWYRYATDPPVTGKCNGHTLATVPTYFAVLIGIVADLILALLPATLIKGANLDQKTKISVCCVLALGSLASVATIARIPYAKQLLSNPDYLYNFTDLAIWSIVECGIAITASSLATLRPLFIKMKLLATSHLTARYGHSRYGSAGLPIQSANTVTVISSRARSSKRHTAMTGSTGLTASTAVTGATSGLVSVKEGKEGIQVEKEFEMSIIAKEPSQDSIDRLEAEVNEVISPGSTRRKPSHDQFSLTSRSNSGRVRSRPPPLQTSFGQASSSASPSTPINASAGTGSSSSGHRFMGQQATASNPPSPQPQGRRPFDQGRMRSASYDRSPRSIQHQFRAAPGGEIGTAYTPEIPTTTTTSRSRPPLSSSHHHHHQHTISEGTIGRSQGVSFAPPNFHLPMMRGPHHSSVASNHSDFSLHEPRATPTDEAGLSAPPRMFPTSHGEYAPSLGNNNNNNNNILPPSPMGSPVSWSGGRTTRSLGSGGGNGGGSPVLSQPHGSPAPTSTSAPRFPFPRSQQGNQRVSAFLAGADEGPEGQGREEVEVVVVHTPLGWSPPSSSRSRRHEMPSPLRSHPPSSPFGGWV